jgi:hypothetical protein
MTLTGIRGKKVGLLVQTCPGCGSIGTITNVSGSVSLGTSTLDSSTLKNKVYVPLVDGASVEDITVTLTTKNKKPVRIDGIVVGR